MKPPVEEPTSRQIRPVGSMRKSRSAPSSLKPPRLAYFCSRLLTSTNASSAMAAPDLLTRAPFTETSPARIIACAL